MVYKKGNKTMRKILWFLLAFCTVALAQEGEPIVSIWASSGKCGLGCCRLEIREKSTFVMTWIINTIDYGTYVLKDDTLELKITHNRDYYEGKGNKTKAQKVWRFLVKGDKLIPLHFSVVTNRKTSVLISTLEEECTIDFMKKLKKNRF